MSIEDRLRDGLARNADIVVPEVERQLATVLNRGRRRSRLRWAGAVAAVAASLVVLAALGPRVLDGIGRDETLVSPVQTPASPTQALTGTFTTTLADTPPVVRDSGLAGRWTIRLHTDGTLTVDAPGSYRGVLSAALFQATTGRLRTSVFDQDLCSGRGVGTYQWTRSGVRLTFTVVDDSCEGRVAVFTSGPWQSIS